MKGWDCKPAVEDVNDPVLNNCFISANPVPGNAPRCKKSNVCLYYLMDFGSVVAAWALGARKNEEIADTCAAPGGKSLILAEGVGEGGHVVCNEMSAARRSKLLKVMKDFVPYDYRNLVNVTGYDATQWRKTARGMHLRFASQFGYLN